MEMNIMMTPGRKKCLLIPNRYMDEPVTTRAEFVYWFSVNDANPQGDPDNNNEPRKTSRGHGMVTSFGIKRKVRDVLAYHFGKRNWMSRGAVLSEGVKVAYNTITGGNFDEDAKAAEKAEKAEKAENAVAAAKPDATAEEKALAHADKRKSKKPKIDRDFKRAAIGAMSQFYDDFRLFGGVLTKPVNAGVPGALQIHHAFSCAPINTYSVKTTRTAVANAESAAVKEGDFGSFTLVEHGVYVYTATINVCRAEAAGTTWGDIDAALMAQIHQFSETNTALRKGVAFERVDIIQHQHKLARKPVEGFYRAIKLTLKSGRLEATCFADYDVTIPVVPSATHTTWTLDDDLPFPFDEEVEAAE